jgi:hypothetical protein
MGGPIVDDDQWGDLLPEDKDDDTPPPPVDWSIPAGKRLEASGRKEEIGRKYDAPKQGSSSCYDPTNAESWGDDRHLDPGWAMGSMRFHLGQDPFDLIEDLRELGELKAEAECDLSALEDALPRVKAEAAAAARKKKRVTTEAHVREMRDRSKSVKDHYAQIDTCRRRVKRLEAEYWALKEQIGMMNSSIYLLQSELRTLRS